MRSKIYKALGCSCFTFLLALASSAAVVTMDYDHAWADEDRVSFEKAVSDLKEHQKPIQVQNKKDLTNLDIHVPNVNWLPEYYAQKEAERLAAEEAARRAEEAKRSKTVRKSSYSSGASYNYPSGGGVLTRSGGVNYYNGRKETWYSQRVLPGGGLNIPGRHVADDGTVRDGDGYVCVAASDLKKGTVVETSLGTGKVYDSGCAAGTTDIYTNW